MATDQKQKDKAIIMAILERFNKFRSAFLNVFTEKVNNGEVLGEYEQSVIRGILEDRAQMYTLMERNPEYKDLYEEGIAAMNDILEKNEENRKKQNKFTS